MGNMYRYNELIVNHEKLSSIGYINENDYREKYYYLFLKLKKIKHGSSLKSKFLNTKLTFYDIDMNGQLHSTALNKIFEKDFDSITIYDVKKIIKCNKRLIKYCVIGGCIERYILTSILFVRGFLHEKYGTKINF